MKTIEEKRKQVEQSAARRAQRTEAEQLRRLEAQGHGHCREAERLRKIIASNSSNKTAA